MDILVSDDEMAELDKDIGSIWQEGGMSCQADGCDVFLDSMMKCRKHWSEIHTKLVSGFQCTLCRFSTMRRNQIRRHMSHVHPNKPTEGLEPSTFLNKKYKNPGNGLIPICEYRTLGDN